MKTLPILILVAHGLCLGSLVLFGLHRLWLLYLKARHPLPAAPPPLPVEALPAVTVQLPIYNEPAVALRLLDAVAGLDYPKSLLEIQVLDDSTDATSWILGPRIRELRARGVRIHHRRRPNRTGFKAGALEEGRKAASGEFLAIFDADFIPQQDFLLRVLPAFRDEQIGMVQARWDHLNAGEHLGTAIQAVMLDGHFAVEHAARNGSGRYFNFNGTAGIWRASCLADAGGWRADTLTEDLDISYRAQLAGWKFRYLPQVLVPAELPARMLDFKAQQARWARGSMQTLRLLFRRLMFGDVPWKVRVEALFHLSANVGYPLLLLMALLAFPSMEIRHQLEWGLLRWIDSLFLGIGMLSVALFYTGASGWRGAKFAPGVIGLGVGISLSNTIAVVRGMIQRGGTFHRTPKGGGGLPVYRSRTSLSSVGEIVLGLYLAAATCTAVGTGIWAGVPFLALFSAGFLYTGVAALRTKTPAPFLAGEATSPASEELSDSHGPLPSQGPWESPARTDALSTLDR